METLRIGRVQETLHRHRFARLHPFRLEHLAEAALADKLQPTVCALSVLEIVELYVPETLPELGETGVPVLALRGESLAQHVFDPSQDTARKRLDEYGGIVAPGMACPSRNVSEFALALVDVRQGGRHDLMEHHAKGEDVAALVTPELRRYEIRGEIVERAAHVS